MSHSMIKTEIEEQKISIHGCIQFNFSLPSSFLYVGHLNIMLNDTTPAGIDLFVDVKENSHLVNRYIIIQNEYQIPPSTAQYRYEHSQSIEIWGINWQIDNYIWHLNLAKTQSDETQVYNFSTNQGIQFPEFTMTTRLRYIYGEKNQGEYLVIYGENALTQSVGWNQIMNQGIRNEKIWTSEIVKLQERTFDIFK